MKPLEVHQRSQPPAAGQRLATVLPAAAHNGGEDAVRRAGQDSNRRPSPARVTAAAQTPIACRKRSAIRSGVVHPTASQTAGREIRQAAQQHRFTSIAVRQRSPDSWHQRRSRRGTGCSWRYGGGEVLRSCCMAANAGLGTYRWPGKPSTPGRPARPKILSRVVTLTFS